MVARHGRWRRQRRLYLAGGAGLAVLLAAHAVLFAATQLVGHNVNRLVKERQAIEGEIQAYRKFSEMKAQAEEIEKLLQKARGTPPDIKRTLAEISLRMPLNVWLTEITVGGAEGGKSPAAGAKTEGAAGGKGGQSAGAPSASGQGRAKAAPAGNAMEVTIKGWAFGHSAVAVWLEDLEKVYGLSDVQCQLSNSEKLGESFMTRFEIKAGLVSGTAGGAGGS